MPSILEAALQIVEDREYQYNIVVADMYFMARLGDDWETMQLIQREAWSELNGQLIALLFSADIEIRKLQGFPPGE